MDNNFLGWKTPVPVEIHNNPQIDILSRLLFFEILTLCQNKEFLKIYWHGNKRIELNLKRGQCLFVISKYSKELGIPRRRIETSLRQLQKAYIEMQIERKAYGLILTLNSYDDIVKMQNEMQNEMKSKRKRNEIEVKSKNKNDKIEKTDKSKKNANTSLKPKTFVLDNFSILELSRKFKVPSADLKEEFEAFVLYWTEENSKGKQKWEMQKTFDPKRRFYAWIRNKKNWSKGKKQANLEIKL